jgi:glyoxylase-like metal-dependent hydrolase (beta-lactamase superfamily II)
MIVETLVVGLLQVNCYVLGCQDTREAVVLDPGDDVEDILAALKHHRLQLKQIVATHGHFDHVLAVDALRRATDAPFLIHRDDLPILADMQSRAAFFLSLRLPAPPAVDAFLSEGDEVTFGQERLRVIHTPGHSPGGVSLYACPECSEGDRQGKVFVGDTLFAGSIGRTDVPGGDYETLLDSVRRKLFPLGDEVVVYAGHGPTTTIGLEKKYNPFFR